VIFEGLNNEYRDHVETLHPGGLGCLLNKTLNENLDFFEYLVMRLRSMKISEKPLVTLFLTLKLCMLRLRIRVSLEVYLIRTLIVHIFPFHLIIVIPLIIRLIPVHCLVDHIDYRH